jgi:CheY-like chemotaxis protein
MTRSNGRPPTILIVEDVDWIRASMQRSVERCGYRAVVAADADEAVAIAERESPALILTEEKLPTFDALLAHLRAQYNLRHIPVVIINPDAADGARHSDAFLLKDYDCLASLLHGSRG